jgi:Ankyrin repeats (3 copies)
MNDEKWSRLTTDEERHRELFALIKDDEQYEFVMRKLTPEFARAVDEDGRTPLHYMKYYVDDIDPEDTFSNAYADTLIGLDADVNAKDKYGRTPMFSLYNVYYVLKFASTYTKVQKDVKGQNGETVLLYVMGKGNEAIDDIVLLLKDPEWRAVLTMKNDKEESAEDVIRISWDESVKDGDLLDTASDKYVYDFFQVDVKTYKDKRGNTLAHHIAQFSYLADEKLAEFPELDFDVCNNAGKTAREMCHEKPLVYWVYHSLLLKKVGLPPILNKENLFRKTNSGEMVLHQLFKVKDEKVQQQIIDAFATFKDEFFTAVFEASNREKKTPAILAFESGDIRYIHRLFGKAPHPYILPILELCSKFRITNLHMAALLGLTDSLRFIMKNGANIHVEDNNNRNALFYAAECGNWDCVRLLVIAGARVDTLHRTLPTYFQRFLHQNVDRRNIIVLFQASVVPRIHSQLSTVPVNRFFSTLWQFLLPRDFDTSPEAEAEVQLAWYMYKPVNKFVLNVVLCAFLKGNLCDVCNLWLFEKDITVNHPVNSARQFYLIPVGVKTEEFRDGSILYSGFHKRTDEVVQIQNHLLTILVDRLNKKIVVFDTLQRLVVGILPFVVTKILGKSFDQYSLVVPNNLGYFQQTLREQAQEISPNKGMCSIYAFFFAREYIVGKGKINSLKHRNPYHTITSWFKELITDVIGQISPYKYDEYCKDHHEEIVLKMKKLQPQFNEIII